MSLGKFDHDLNQQPPHRWWLVREIITKWPNNSGSWIILVFPDESSPSLVPAEGRNICDAPGMVGGSMAAKSLRCFSWKLTSLRVFPLYTMGGSTRQRTQKDAQIPWLYKVLWSKWCLLSEISFIQHFNSLKNCGSLQTPCFWDTLRSPPPGAPRGPLGPSWTFDPWAQALGFCIFQSGARLQRFRSRPATTSAGR